MKLPTLQHPCARCAGITRTCCERGAVALTAGDVARIGAHLGRDDFWAREAPDDPWYLEERGDPRWVEWLFAPDGTRPVLRRGPDDRCGLLGPRGCTLPMEVRPLVCRLHPFDYTEQGITGAVGGCPGELVPPGRTILEVLEMSPEAARRWHRMLYTELRTGAPCPDEEIPA